MFTLELEGRAMDAHPIESSIGDEPLKVMDTGLTYLGRRILIETDAPRIVERFIASIEVGNAPYLKAIQKQGP